MNCPVIRYFDDRYAQSKHNKSERGVMHRCMGEIRETQLRYVMNYLSSCKNCDSKRRFRFPPKKNLILIIINFYKDLKKIFLN